MHSQFAWDQWVRSMRSFFAWDLWALHWKPLWILSTCAVNAISRKKIFMKFGICFAIGNAWVRPWESLCMPSVCVCACVCFQYCCHVITQYYLLVLWILCMLFLLRDPRGCAWEALVDLVWSSWLHFGRNACKYRYTNSCFVLNNFLFHRYNYDCLMRNYNKMDRVFWSLRKANNNLQLKKRGCSGSKEKHICKNIFALWWSQFVLVDQNCFGNCQRFLG